MTTVARLTQGLASALTWPHGTRGWVVDEPAAARGRIPATVVATRQASSDTLHLFLKPGRGWVGHTPGQWVRVTVEIDGRLKTRCYSIISLGAGREGGLVELGIRREGQVSTFLHEHARAGLVVGLSAPQGDYVIPATAPARLVLVSAGSGITGTVALLRQAIAGGLGSRCTVVHYTRDADDVPFAEEIVAAGGRIVCTTTEGRIDALAGLPLDAHVFACGPPSLLSDLRERWAGAITTEEFAAPVIAVGGARGTVQFESVDGTTTTVPDDGSSLLDQAEKAGLTPAFGCRQGVCRTCVVRLTSGSCLTTTGSEPVTGPDATVALCTSVAVGDVTLAGLTSEGEIA